MGTEKQIKSNPVDVIKGGQVSVVLEGLLVFDNPIVILDDGLLLIEDNGTLKLKD